MKFGTDWNDFCTELHTGKDLYVYGVGRQCDFFYYVVPEESAKVKGYFDTYRKGKSYHGQQVLGKKAVAEIPENSILLITSLFGIEIFEDISDLLPEHTSVYLFNGKMQAEVRWEHWFKLMKMMEDVYSQQLLFDLHGQLIYGGDSSVIGGIAPWYFNDDIFKKKREGVYVDGGTLFGETIINYITWMKGKYTKIYGFEPSKPIYDKLMKSKNLEEYDNIVVKKAALWKENTTQSFIISTVTPGGSTITEHGNEVVDCVAIDTEIKEKVAMIKMDIEGAEWEALHGAEQTIKRDKPDLAISVYHKPEDLYRIPYYIHQLVPEYKLYLRHHAMNLYEIVLYATVPDEDNAQ